MKIYTDIEILQMVCKANNKWGMLISFDTENYEELLKAAPYLTFNDDFQVIINGAGFMLLDFEEDLDYYYSLTIGDDGPTENNKYNGITRIYALTCDPQGNLMNENT